MILAFCDRSYIVEILLIIKTFFKMACYLAPLIVIIVSIAHIFKIVINGKEDDLKEAFKVTVKRIIAGLIIAFLPAIINYVFTGILDVSEVEFLACFESASKEKVASLKAKEEAEAEAERKAQEKQDEAQLRKAWEEEQKTKQGNKQSFEEWKKKKEEEERKKREQEQQAQQAGSTLPDGTVTPVTIGANGVNVKQYSGNGVTMKYYEIVPTNMKSNLPIIIFLHGSGEIGSVSGVGNLPIVSYVANNWDRNGKPFIFLAPVAPNRGWSGNNNAAAKAIIDQTIREYNADPSRIYITGMSMGGAGTWNMVSTYGSYFAAAMPMSGCGSSHNISNFANVPVYAIVGGAESDTKSCMNNIVNNINSSGGRASLDVVQGASHGTIQRYYKNEKLYDWLLSQ